jgi:hypothetical protein
MNDNTWKTRRVIAALLLALVGLTILPGFKCSYEDDNRKIIVEH